MREIGRESVVEEGRKGGRRSTDAGGAEGGGYEFGGDGVGGGGGFGILDGLGGEDLGLHQGGVVALRKVWDRLNLE